MKPHRLVMTHHLVMSYDLHKRMEIYVRARRVPAQRG
jgi:histone deacetylase 1/2